MRGNRDDIALLKLETPAEGVTPAMLPGEVGGRCTLEPDTFETDPRSRRVVPYGFGCTTEAPRHEGRPYCTSQKLRKGFGDRCRRIDGCGMLATATVALQHAGGPVLRDGEILGVLSSSYSTVSHFATLRGASEDPASVRGWIETTLARWGESIARPL